MIEVPVSYIYECAVSDRHIATLKNLVEKSGKYNIGDKISFLEIYNLLGFSASVQVFSYLVKGYGKVTHEFAVQLTEVLLPNFESQFPSSSIPKNCLELSREFRKGNVTDDKYFSEFVKLYFLHRDLSYDLSMERNKEISSREENEAYFRLSLAGHLTGRVLSVMGFSRQPVITPMDNAYESYLFSKSPKVVSKLKRKVKILFLENAKDYEGNVCIFLDTSIDSVVHAFGLGSPERLKDDVDLEDLIKNGKKICESEFLKMCKLEGVYGDVYKNEIL